MAQRGPLPQRMSSATERRSNSFGDRLPAATTAKPPSLPKRLSGAAAAFWHKHAGELHSDGHLTERDAGAFTRLCCLWGQLCELDTLLESEGLILISPTGTSKAHPAAGMRSATEKQFLQHCQQFSMTAASRMRVPSAEPQSPQLPQRMRRIRE
jgi:P27 family predicted phage terminase small subunit